jgi:hypothetical protein
MFDRCLNFAIHATVSHVLSPQVRVAAIPPRRPFRERSTKFEMATSATRRIEFQSKKPTFDTN